MRTTNSAQLLGGAAAAVVTAVTLTACSGGGDSSGGTPSQTMEVTTSASATAPAGPTRPAPPVTSTADPGATSAAGSAQIATALAAVSTAERAVAGGKVFDLELDRRQGRQLWEAKVAAGGRQLDLDISPDGSTVLHRAQDPTPDDDVATLHRAKVTLQRAVGIAADRATGKGDLSALEIDTERGTLVWQVEFGGDHGTTVLVDAIDGKVVRVGSDAG